MLVLLFFEWTALVLAPLEKRFLPNIVSASTWKNFSDLASFQIERGQTIGLFPGSLCL
jgi:hypothetical protein